MKKVIADGAVGKVLSVHFEWLLDTVHGADYFRRWHREKTSSGGLAVHKATHHFDLVNWWLDDTPTTVQALGGLRFYGDQGAGRLPGPRPSLGRDAAADDPYGFDMSGDGAASTWTPKRRTDTCVTATSSTRASTSRTPSASSSATAAAAP
ncbi:Gfo/Idh/MocA family oxidoreductase [Streptomyces sp. NPDC059894]|uniref:Gfo/Idh/MocA family oxidoreductase n=1 Tax=unclassified Streptomyces TaxID=2593676 RepID=UPI003656F6DD